MLTKKQIAYLFDFCRKHYVYFYEQQTELVDHLANGIEEEMKKNNQISFEKALDKVYARFGVMGFSTFAREKSVQVSRRVRRDFFRQLLHQFRWPTVLRFLLTIFVVYTVCLWSPVTAIILAALTVLSAGIYEYFQYWKIFKSYKNFKSKFLLAAHYFPISIVWIYTFYYTQIFMKNIFEVSLLSINPILLAGLTGVSLITTLASIHLYKQINDELKKTYPEAFQVAQ